MKKFRNLTLSLLVILFSIISINSYASTKQADEWINMFRYELMTLEPSGGEETTYIRSTLVIIDFQNKQVAIQYDKDKKHMTFSIVKIKLDQKGMILACQNETGIYYMRLILNVNEATEKAYYNYDLVVLDSDNNRILYNAAKSGSNPVK